MRRYNKAVVTVFLTGSAILVSPVLNAGNAFDNSCDDGSSSRPTSHSRFGYVAQRRFRRMPPGAFRRPLPPRPGYGAPGERGVEAPVTPDWVQQLQKEAPRPGFGRPDWVGMGPGGPGFDAPPAPGFDRPAVPDWVQQMQKEAPRPDFGRPDWVGMGPGGPGFDAPPAPGFDRPAVPDWVQQMQKEAPRPDFGRPDWVRERPNGLRHPGFQIPPAPAPWAAPAYGYPAAGPLDWGPYRQPQPAPAAPAVQSAGSPSPVPVTEAKVAPNAPAAADADADGVMDEADLCPGTAAGAPVDGFGCTKAEPVVLRGVNFKTDSDQLTGESSAILDRVASTLKAHPDLKVEIAGHTDSDGDEAHNLDLSQRRAVSVMKYLFDRGVPADNLQARGYGEGMPVASNDTAEGKALNRRVELKRQ